MTYLSNQKKSQFSILDLEDYIINQFESLNSYFDEGGYELFYSLVRELEASSHITPVKSAAKITNNRRNSLPVKWKKVKENHTSKWTKQQIFQVADRLDVSFYINNPEQQNDEIWKHIMSIHGFLGEAEKWEWESKASRSYQLFKDEKYLNEAGKNLLRRLKLSSHELKIRNYGEPFSYFVHPQILHFSEVRSVLIIENLSFFHACRRVFKRQEKILGMKVDMIIYAEGTHIESSIKYLQDIIEHGEYRIHYVGDMDPSGYSIYYRLKTKNPQYDIALAEIIYFRMLEECAAPTPINKGQIKVNEHFRFFIEELGDSSLVFCQKAREMWDRNLRIPQEVLPVDVLLKGEGKHA